MKYKFNEYISYKLTIKLLPDRLYDNSILIWNFRKYHVDGSSYNCQKDYY